MFQHLNIEKSKRIISSVLITYIFLAEMIYSGFAGSISHVSGFAAPFSNSVNANIANADSQEASIPISGCIEQVSGVVSHAALVKESSFLYRVDGNVRLTKKKSNGYERTVRVYLLGLFIATLLLVVSLMLSRYLRCPSLVKQRLSTIIYIHNKDGRKGRYLSCIQ